MSSVEDEIKSRNNEALDIDETLEALRDRHSTEKRYVYTDQHGWIDLRHFFKAANYSEDIGSVATEFLGFGVELRQWLREGDDSYKSGFSPEDLPSNHAGAEFGDDYIQDGSELIDALKQFFEDAGARSQKDPKSGWDDLPDTDPAVRGGENRGKSNLTPSKLSCNLCFSPPRNNCKKGGTLY